MANRSELPPLTGAASSEFAGALEALRSERPPRNARLREAERAIRENRMADADEILSHFLSKHPADAIGLHLMAETALRTGRRERAEALLARCVALAPDFAAARYSYANVLAQLNKPQAAFGELEVLLKRDPCNILYRNMQAAILTAVGRYADSLRCYASMAEEFPNSPEALLEYGSALRSMGLTEEAIEVYRRTIALSPSSGEAYWRLAALKSYRFGEAEIDDMQRQLARPDISGDGRMYFHFALAKALGDRDEYERSFENYARANALKRLATEYDPDAFTRHVQACKVLFTPEFFQKRVGAGCEATGPIFIIGMQRAGSTLIEQILASHSAVEATAELPNISLLAEHIGETVAPTHGAKYPDVLAQLDAATIKSFGEQYLETTETHRTLKRPFFTDKMPYNFLHLGLIHLILPNARIIDARRHPLGCCFSNFAMHFRAGALFAYRLTELGQAYRDYVELMAHFDRVLPGRTHRVFYEDLVGSPEREIRHLLDYLGLPFEGACLEFHKSSRAMDSASSEQVRRPMYHNAVDEWRHYEAWLGPLKLALGPVLEAYPDVPLFAD